jgi:hypothetical protein
VNVLPGDVFEGPDPDGFDSAQGFVGHLQSKLMSRGLLEEKRWLLKRFVSSLVMNGDKREVICEIRTIPIVDDQVGGIYERLEKTKTATVKPPFRKVGVAGTGLEPATFGL